MKPICILIILALAVIAITAAGCGEDDPSASDGQTTDDDPSADSGQATEDDDDSAADDDDNDDDDAGPVDPFLNPQEMGPYIPGNTSYYMTDETRNLSCGEGKRRLVVEVWYPAADNADQGEENTLFDFFLDQKQAVIDYYTDMGFPPSPEDDYPTGSYRDAPIHPEAPPMPILVFSHGFTSTRFQNYSLADYLASHGYVVVSPDHTCNAGIAPFPDGIIFPSLLDAPLTIFERVDDVSFLIDVFTENPPELFAGRLDAAHVGIFGHSFGGWTVSEAIKHEKRATAMVQLASFGLPPVPEDVSAASMYFWGQQDRVMNTFAGWHQANIDNMPRPKWELEFIDTGHFAFSDLCLYNPDLPFGANGCGSEDRVVGEGTFTNPTPEEMAQMYHPYVGAFFGGIFFEYEELFDFISVNHHPDRIVMYAQP